MQLQLLVIYPTNAASSYILSDQISEWVAAVRADKPVYLKNCSNN